MALSTNDKKWIEGKFESLRNHITQNRIDIAVLKVKSGVWGLLGGLVPVLITIALYFVFKG
jgi:hypothetical protein